MSTVSVDTVFPVEFTIGHFSDTHIGYEAYKALSASGENQRAVDVAKAFSNVVSEIVAADPPLVIHSGDMADRTVIPIRMILFLRQQLQRLAAIRPDGSRRQVVLIAGNHEIPRSRKEACFLHLFEGLPGVHVVTRDYESVTFPDTGVSENAPSVLCDVVVHCLPHDALKTVEFDTVVPVDGKVNVLTAHGVAGGSELYVRSLGREFTIPTDVLARDWEYVALGHWHKQGPVPLVGLGSSDDDHGRVWYAGATENMGFGDLRENGMRRGWLEVTARPGQDPLVVRRHVPVRPMLRLPVLDASSLSPEEIADRLITEVRNAPVAGAVVGQLVENVPRDVWSLVDLSRARAAAADALHYEVTLRSRRLDADTADASTEPSPARGLGDADRVLVKRADELLAENEREGGLALARELLAIELERSVRGTDDASPAVQAGAAADGAAPTAAQCAPPAPSSTEETFS